MQKTKHWWLEKDCRKCISYPDCDFVERKCIEPRGCSLYVEKPLSDVTNSQRTEYPEFKRVKGN